jgi:Cu+-exporting ATPase
METAVDPVCKMKVDPEETAAKAEHQGQIYYFCAPGCKAAFEREPAKYLKADSGNEARPHGHEH